MGLSCSCEDFDKGDFENWWGWGAKPRLQPASSAASVARLFRKARMCDYPAL